ncbi:MAG: TetR family transcriptional regulator [Acidobacteriota bacterium]
MNKTREQLEALATDLVQRDGLSSFSFRTLADQVGIKSASVHYHFPAKADLANALIEEYSEHFRGDLEAISQRPDSLRVKLESLIAIFEGVLAENKLCLCGALAAEASSLDETGQRLLRRYFDASVTWIEETLEAHPDQVRTPIPPPQLARVLFSGLEGALLLDRVGEDQEHLAAMRALVHSVTL